MPLRPFALLLALLAPCVVQAEPVAATYTLRFPAPQTHYFEVEATMPSAADTLEVFLPVWSPGSYLVREYARHLEHVQAVGADGKPRPIEKTAKNRWTVRKTAREPVTIKYRVYARELTVRTNFVDADFASLSGPATFLAPVGALGKPYAVRVELPRGWDSVQTALDPDPDGGRWAFTAPHYDGLVDSPIIAGAPRVDTFTVDGIDHRLVTFDADDRWDNPRAARDLAKLVGAHRDFWGGLPERDYDRYVFLNLLVGRGGGLEHHDSTVIMGDRLVQQRPKDYGNWLRLASHEFFHTWNVKRLRPKALGPFDYERENHTRSLWIAEGITSYFDALLTRRAGLIDDAFVLDRLSKRIASIQRTPGRKVRSLELASFDAWIRYYRPDENSKNTNISYYTKGAVVAFLLDAEIQRRTQGKKRLDDVMRLAWSRYGAEGYTPDGFYALISEVAGADLGPWLAANVAGTGELDYAPALAWFGLRFKAVKVKPDTPITGWLGLSLNEGPRPTVSEVNADAPGRAAGINVGDELLAIGDDRVPKAGWKAALARTRPGQRAEVLVSRRGRLRRIPVTFGTPPSDRWTLEADPKATKAQKARLSRLMSGR